MATIPEIRAVVTEVVEQITSRFHEELRNDLATMFDARFDTFNEARDAAAREARLALMESFMAAERGVNGKADPSPPAAAASRPPTARAREAAVTSRPSEVMEPALDSQQGAAKDPLVGNDPWRNANGAAARSATAPSAPLAPPPCPGASRHEPAVGAPPLEHIRKKAAPPAKPPPKAMAAPAAEPAGQQPLPVKPPPANLRQAPGGAAAASGAVASDAAGAAAEPAAAGRPTPPGPQEPPPPLPATERPPKAPPASVVNREALGEEEPPPKAAPKLPPAKASPSQGGLPVKPAPPLGSGSDPLPAKAPPLGSGSDPLPAKAAPLPVKPPPPLGARQEAPAAAPLIRKAPPAQFAR